MCGTIAGSFRSGISGEWLNLIAVKSHYCFVLTQHVLGREHETAWSFVVKDRQDLVYFFILE